MTDRPAAIAALRASCDQISRLITGMHPVVPQLADPGTQTEAMRALFELTKQVEVVKKHLLKLEKRDDSTAL